MFSPKILFLCAFIGVVAIAYASDEDTLEGLKKQIAHNEYEIKIREEKLANIEKELEELRVGLKHSQDAYDELVASQGGGRKRRHLGAVH